MKENLWQSWTPLHHATRQGHEQIVNSLLKAFSEGETDNWIDIFDEPENQLKRKLQALQNALHTIKWRTRILLLLNEFNDEKNEKLIEFLMKENQIQNEQFYIMLQ